MKTLYAAVFSALFSLPANGQPTDTTRSALTLSGYVEAYYAHDFTSPKTVQERPGFLYNHKRNREVNINLAFIKAAYTSERIRSNLALQVGTYAQYNYASEQELVKNIFEANAGIKLSGAKDLWFDAGIFTSHLGFESAISKDCWTLTRSILAENSPYYLAGAKLTYNAPNGKWTLLGMAANGWQRIRRLPGYSGPSLTTQVQYRPSPKLTLNWSSFLGSDRPDSLRQRRLFTNLYAIWQPTEAFGVIIGFDIGTDWQRAYETGPSVWYAPVVIARVKSSAKSYVNGRVEYYDDRNAVITGVSKFQVWGYSLGYDYAITPAALFRIEGKIYNSGTPIFETTNGTGRLNASLTTSLAVSF